MKGTDAELTESVNEKTVINLRPCPFCGRPAFGVREISKCEDGNTMYIFAIKHTCDAIDQAHLSLFFQNDDTREKCIETLDKDCTLYTRLWNTRACERAS